MSAVQPSASGEALRYHVQWPASSLARSPRQQHSTKSQWPCALRSSTVFSCRGRRWIRQSCTLMYIPVVGNDDSSARQSPGQQRPAASSTSALGAGTVEMQRSDVRFLLPGGEAQLLAPPSLS